MRLFRFSILLLCLNQYHCGNSPTTQPNYLPTNTFNAPTTSAPCVGPNCHPPGSCHVTPDPALTQPPPPNLPPGTTVPPPPASSGTPPSYDLPNGTPCGSNLVCSAGLCTSCVNGMACTLPNDPCRRGQLICNGNGTPTCKPGTTLVPDGTACVAGQSDFVCVAGTCTSCPNFGSSCSTESGCMTGTISCPHGKPECTTESNVTDLRQCTTTDAGTGFCEGGRCHACTAFHKFPTGRPCDDDKLCCAGYVCSSSGGCLLPADAYCDGDQDCASGICVGHTCKTSCQTDECENDSHCCGGTAYGCVNGHCLAHCNESNCPTYKLVNGKVCVSSCSDAFTCTPYCLGI